MKHHRHDSNLNRQIGLVCGLFLFISLFTVQADELVCDEEYLNDAAEKLLSNSAREIEKGRQTLRDCGKSATSTLREIVENDQSTVDSRSMAAALLANLAKEDDGALQTVLSLLKKNEPLSLRKRAVSYLEAPEFSRDIVIDALLGILQDRTDDSRVRRTVARSLSVMSRRQDEIVKRLTTVASDDSEEIDVRNFCIAALGKLSSKSAATLPYLVEQMESQETVLDRNVLAQAIENIVDGIVLANDSKGREVISSLERRLGDSLSESPLPGVDAVRQKIISGSELLRSSGVLVQLVETFRELYESKWGLIIPIYLLWLVVCFVIYMFWPASILRITRYLTLSMEYLPKKLGGVNIPLHLVMVLPMLKYRPRVAAAWLNGKESTIKQVFASNSAVMQREVYVTLPVLMNGKLSEDFVDIEGRRFLRGESSGNRMLIWGEGGIGKTSLAIQLAKAALDPVNPKAGLILPILVDVDFCAVESKSLLDVIRETTVSLTDEDPQLVTNEFLNMLVKAGRLLLIVDHLSEMSEGTQQQIQKDLPELRKAKLVVTSRIREKLTQGGEMEVIPMKVGADHLTAVFHAYLSRMGKIALFTDEELAEGCAALASLLKDRDSPFILIKLYLEQFVLSKEEGDLAAMPATVPDIMLRYVTLLNRSVPDESRLDDRDVLNAVTALAWQCLKDAYKPRAVLIEKLTGGEEASFSLNTLDYTEKKLRLTETVKPTLDRMRFTLDPVAEYLAARYLVVECGDKDEAWQEVLDKAVELHEKHLLATEFLAALRENILSYAEDRHTPQQVLSTLDRILAEVRQVDRENSQPQNAA